MPRPGGVLGIARTPGGLRPVYCCGMDHSTARAAKATTSVLAFLVLVEITSGFVQGFYTPVLPELAKHVGVSGEAMNWFQTAQAMAAAVVVPLMARMGDMYGPRKVLRVAVVAVLAGALLVALVPSYPIVLLGRILIGPLGVWLALSIAIIYVRAAGGNATRSISILSASLMGGIVLGTVAAGLAERFLPNIVLTLLVPSVMVLLCVYAVFFKLPKDIDLSPGKIDWVGFIGLGAVMVSLILALAYMGPTHATLSTILFVVTVALFAAWVWWERKAPDPAIDLGMVVSKSLGPLYIAAFAMGVIMIDAPPNLADFLSRDPELYGFGFAASSERLAVMIAVMLIFATAGALSSTFIAAKLSMRKTLVGAALVGAVGQLLLLLLPHIAVAFWVSGALTGFGLGVLVGALPALVSRAAPEGKTGIANGIYSALLAMGGAVGGAIFKQLLAVFRDSDHNATLGGYQATWALSVVLFLVAAWMMAKVNLNPKEQATAEA